MLAMAPNKTMMDNDLSRVPGARPRRILIDATATHRCDFAGGIQRVVRNLVNSTEWLEQELHVPCQGVEYDPHSGFRAVDSLPNPEDHSQPSPFLRRGDAAPPPPPPPQPLWKRGARRSLEKVGMLGFAKRIHTSLRNRNVQAPPTIATPPSRGVQVGAGDLLLLPDTTWGTLEVLQSAREARERGARVAAVVYDLIPLRQPGICSQAFVDMFRAWWDDIRRLVDFVACISESVWDDVQDYVVEHPLADRPTKRLLGGSFRLGAGLDSQLDHSLVRPELQYLFAGKPLDNPYLLPASFDVRKNHALVISAFERLWACGLPLQLVIIARKYRDHPLPLSEQVINHPEFNRRLFWYYDVEDAELDFCYRKAAATITASYAEGFNLPIVESMSRGRPVLATDIPVNREIGGAHTAYFPPHSAEELAHLILRFRGGELPKLLHRIDEFRWPNWQESSQELLEKILALYAKTESAAKVAA
jgi:glycosyltransferase involved in cell wall biosynthesis